MHYNLILTTSVTYIIKSDHIQKGLTAKSMDLLGRTTFDMDTSSIFC